MALMNSAKPALPPTLPLICSCWLPLQSIKPKNQDEGLDALPLVVFRHRFTFGHDESVAVVAEFGSGEFGRGWPRLKLTLCFDSPAFVGMTKAWSCRVPLRRMAAVIFGLAVLSAYLTDSI